ncbi:aldehyde dehydrogenase family protein [Streptomyces chiangmaiensis]|uniref:Aldehyde dehydrogenase family protein n=1 Tax=Streptomyces chiangmaiensis TaxID=766497 RepID=A0ABU7FD14_9ACTN|nr:aldehyde dehydrogenase family protein [Streptomyces chiangmaiensis]MED7822056.1 aldehyde dehydrogenase family protein [Streptomyces chiangmaiensis]
MGGEHTRPTVPAGVGDGTPACTEDVFGPVAPMRPFHIAEEAATLASAGPHCPSVGIVTRDTAHGLELAERIHAGTVHINDRSVSDDTVEPFGAAVSRGTAARFGSEAAVEAFTGRRRTTVREEMGTYPFQRSLPDVTRRSAQPSPAARRPPCGPRPCPACEPAR